MVNLGPVGYLAASVVHDALKALRRGGRAPPSAFTLRQLLERRRPERRRLYALPADAPALDALALMLAEHVSCVAVTRPGGGRGGDVVVGVLSQGDYLRRVAAPERSARATALGAVMTPIERTAYCYPDTTVDDGLATLAVARCHHLPVLTGDPVGHPPPAVLGILSQDELLGLTREVRDERAQAAVTGAGLRWYGGGDNGGGATTGDATTTAAAAGDGDRGTAHWAAAAPGALVEGCRHCSDRQPLQPPNTQTPPTQQELR